MTDDLRAQLAQLETLLENNTRLRQQSIADGNREIAGKIHQAEREFKKRIDDLKARIAAEESPA